MPHNSEDESPSTSNLLSRLFKTSDLKEVKEFIKTNDGAFVELTFHSRIQQRCAERNLVAEHVIKNCGINRTYGHQLFSGVRKPSRDKVIQLAFGFPLTIGETQELLKLAGKSPLYPKIRRDAVVLYCLNNRLGFMQVQQALQELGLPLLGNEEYFE